PEEPIHREFHWHQPDWDQSSVAAARTFANEPGSSVDHPARLALQAGGINPLIDTKYGCANWDGKHCSIPIRPLHLLQKKEAAEISKNLLHFPFTPWCANYTVEMVFVSI